MQKTLSEILYGVSPIFERGVRYFILFLLFLIVLSFIHASLTGFMAAVILALGILIPVYDWVKKDEGELPFVVVYSLTTAIWYLLPIALGNEIISIYSDDEWLSASIEVFTHLIFLSIGYQVLGAGFSFKKPSSARVLDFIGMASNARKVRLLLFVFVGIVTFEWLRLRTPYIYYFISYTLSNVLSTFVTVLACGSAMLLTYHMASIKRPTWKFLFWSFWVLFVMVKASGLILAGTIAFVMATIVGLILGRKKIPWVFLITTVLIFAFLNQGKFEIREINWVKGTPSSLISLYSDWVEASYELSTGQRVARYTSGVDVTGQSLFGDRLSNMQMLLFVQDKVIKGNVSLLLGETYLYGPMLLVPRFIWPDKPTAHQSQIKLNLHFGRNLYEYGHERKTFIAWGILPEAYGNFGPYFGAIISGLFLGIVFKFLAVFALQYPLNSLRTIMALTLLALSFSWPTMESSLIVTSTFQVVILISVLGFFLSRKVRITYNETQTSYRGAVVPINNSVSHRRL